MKNRSNRRRFLSLSVGLAAGIPYVPALLNASSIKSVPIEGQMERLAPDWGYHASRGGPITTIKDGSLLWVTTDPEAPYLAKAMWSITRLSMRKSNDKGKTWSKSQVLDHGTTEYSVLSHVVHQTASGKILHIYARYGGYDHETGTPEKSLAEVFYHHSLDNGETWSKPNMMPTGERYHGDILSMEQLRNGRLVYPFCFLTNVKSQFAVSAMYSDDDGETWKRSISVLGVGGGGFESGASEPTIVELKSGKLWMLIRAQTGFLWESYSSDGGLSWSPATESNLPSSNAPATMLRLKSGEIAIAWNLHIHSNYARQSLVIGLTDDGKSFRGIREFDFTDFTDNPTASIPHVTYPFLSERSDGVIVVSYNKGNWSRHNRPSLAIINKSWILEKHNLVNFDDGRTSWHTIDPGPRLEVAIEKYEWIDSSLWLEIRQHPKNNRPTGIVRNIPLVASGEIQIALRVTKPDAYIIFGNTLISPRNIDEGCLRIRISDKKVYLSAGTEERLDNDRKSTKYTYLSHQIKDEIEYPDVIDQKDVLNISVRYHASQGKANISINNGQTIELQKSNILGLSFVGLSIANGGEILLRSISTIIN